MSDLERFKFKLKNSEIDHNSFRASLKLLGGPGEALIQLIYGIEDARAQKRVEETIKEVYNKLEDIGAKIEDQEVWDRLTYAASPTVGRATSEDARQRFRDLLFNSAKIPPGDPDWEESFWSLEKLNSLKPAALAILAHIHRCYQVNKRLVLVPGGYFRTPLGRFTEVFADGTEERLGRVVNCHVELDTMEEVDMAYHPVILDNAIHTLISEDLIYLGPIVIDRRDGTEGSLLLKEKGRLLIQWTMADF